MILEAVLLGLAGWRVASMLVGEDGPSGIFEKLRRAVGVKEGPVEGFLPSVFSCIMCMTVWTTMLAYLLWQIEPVLVMLLAAMTIALLADSLFKAEH